MPSEDATPNAMYYILTQLPGGKGSGWVSKGEDRGGKIQGRNGVNSPTQQRSTDAV
jgi:hypothetical protein